jgi:choline kinase
VNVSTNRAVGADPAQIPFVIAAAGRGSRLGFGMPKCLVEVAGEMILYRQLRLLAHATDVRVVVGFQADRVREVLRGSFPNVQVVHNPDWETTNTLASLELATRDVEDRCVIIDGDLVLDPHDFDRFLGVAREGDDTCVAITPAGTEDGVFVVLDDDPDHDGRAVVREFRRSPSTAYEWSGLAMVEARRLRARDGWVYSALEVGLPLRAGVVRAWEIDTVADLGRAEAALKTLVR